MCVFYFYCLQHPGHHRDKLDLIRDSLKPFEQNTDPTQFYLSRQTASAPLLTDDNYDESHRYMINALTQGGYDVVSVCLATSLFMYSYSKTTLLLGICVPCLETG